MVKEDTVMRKKGFMVLGVTVAMSLSLPLLSYAGEWKEDNIGKWYQNDDGTYPVNRWQWIDGNNDGIAENYYFDENGYLLTNTKTPDGLTVNEDGVWFATSINPAEVPVTTINAERLNKINTGVREIYRQVEGECIGETLEIERLEDGSLAVSYYTKYKGLTEFIYPRIGEREWGETKLESGGGIMSELIFSYVFNEDYSEVTVTTIIKAPGWDSYTSMDVGKYAKQ